MSKRVIQWFQERFLPLDFAGSRPLIERGVIAAGLSVLSPPKQLERIAPQFHTLLYADNDSGVLRFGDTPVTLKQNALWFIPAGQTYVLTPRSRRFQLMWFHIRPARRWAHLERQPAHSCFAGQAHRMVYVLAGLITEAQAPQHDRTEMGKHFAEVLRIFLERRLHVDANVSLHSGRERMGKVWEHVEQDLARPWTVTDLARIYGISVPHFYRLTKHFHQTSPLKVVTQLRMRRAQELLANTDHKLHALARMLGYESSFSFSKAFKQGTGIAPHDYRRRLFESR